MPETITLPRKKHSHRCKICRHGVYCYKSQCLQPQRIEACANCEWKAKQEREAKFARRVRVTFYFAGTGREQSSHDCDTAEEAFERLQRTNMEAIAFLPAKTHGYYTWHPNQAHNLEDFKTKLEIK